MLIKFKNGYSVRITDCEGKSYKECIEAARAAVKRIEDASLGRTYTTNVSFSPMRIREALKTQNKEALQREFDFLKRDVEADFNTNKNYVNIYSPEMLQKIVDQYTKAVDLLEKADMFGQDLNVLRGKILDISRNWKLLDEVFNCRVITKSGQRYDFPAKTVEAAQKWIDDKCAELIENGDEIITADAASSATGEVLYIYDENKKVEDKAPYFEPTESPVIESEYSTERLEKEIAHPEGDEPDIRELNAVFNEIDEFILQGPQILVNAGWSRQDARQAIDKRYYELLKNLRKYGWKDEASQLRAKIKKLEKAWDLVR